MILLDKNYEEIMEETLTELEGMGIDRNAGSTARLLLTIMNKRLSTYYESLKTNHMQAFVSKATNNFLDEIGLLVDCSRLPEEVSDDEAYRYRITKQIQVHASANIIAIRLAALSVDGVQDVMLRRWTHGTGSFSVYVITENPITPQSILDQVQEKIDNVESFGVRGEVFRPNILGVEMKVRLVFKKTVPDLERKLALTQAYDEMRNYLSTRNVGDSLLIQEINKLLKTVHDGIEEVIIFDYRIAERPVLAVDQTCSWNERYVQSSKANSIQVL